MSAGGKLSVMSRTVAAVLAVLLVAIAVPVAAQDTSSEHVARVVGSVSYRERIALTPEAIVEVFLDDVSRADAPATTLASTRIERPGQVPVRFELTYDPLRIDPTHRYAIRARIIEDGQLSFTTAHSEPVITQEHGNAVALMLRRVPRMAPASAPAVTSRTAPAAVSPASAKPPASAVSVPAAASAASRAAAAPVPVPAARPAPALPPPVALTNLPATFTGTIPCADCSGIRYQLNLFPDDAYVLKMLYVGRPSPATQDEIGSWALSSDRRAIALKSSSGLMQFFAIVDGLTLRKLDVYGADIASTLSYTLRRAPAVQPLDVRLPLRGAYRAGGQFIECSTGRRWTVARDATIESLDAAYAAAAKKPGDAVVLSLDGRLMGEDALVVIGDVKAWPNETCAVRFGAATLENTQWRLSSVRGVDVPPADRPSNEPGLFFRLDSRSFSGSDGCNRLAGSYDRAGDTMRLMSAGTLMACAGGETRLAAALTDVRSYRVIGDQLDLYDASRRPVARFQAVAR